MLSRKPARYRLDQGKQDKSAVYGIGYTGKAPVDYGPPLAVNRLVAGSNPARGAK
jgi:hypothetical protein